MTADIIRRLQELVEREGERPDTHTVLLGVQSADGRVDFAGAAGDTDPDSPYFVASVTKMYTVAVLMQLVDEGRLDLDAPVTDHLPHEMLEGIHVYKGVDYSHQLRVYQLIHQTSGLADYFEDRLARDLAQNIDHAYSLDDVLAMVREMTPKSDPDAAGGRKSHYSDTNYQLLGAMIEAITGQSLAENYRARILERLELANTFLFDVSAPVRSTEPLPVYWRERPLSIPLSMSSERGAGGIVSNLPDSLRFLQAYFDGSLFRPVHFERIYRWNSLFFPIQYGYGLMRMKLPRVMTLFRYSPELIGHSGSSGSFAFYAPKEALYIAGTFNQVDKPSRPFNFMFKVAAAVS